MREDEIIQYMVKIFITDSIYITSYLPVLKNVIYVIHSFSFPYMFVYASLYFLTRCWTLSGEDGGLVVVVLLGGGWEDVLLFPSIYATNALTKQTVLFHKKKRDLSPCVSTVGH